MNFLPITNRALIYSCFLSFCNLIAAQESQGVEMKVIDSMLTHDKLNNEMYLQVEIRNHTNDTLFLSHFNDVFNIPENKLGSFGFELGQYNSLSNIQKAYQNRIFSDTPKDSRILFRKKDDSLFLVINSGHSEPLKFSTLKKRDRRERKNQKKYKREIQKYLSRFKKKKDSELLKFLIKESKNNIYEVYNFLNLFDQKYILKPKESRNLKIKLDKIINQFTDYNSSYEINLVSFYDKNILIDKFNNSRFAKNVFFSGIIVSNTIRVEGD